MKIITATVLLTMFGAAAGCESGAKPEPKMAPASRSVPEVEQAAQTLAKTRCERAQRCNEIGPNAKFETMDDCNQTMLVKAQQELGDCHKGIDQGDFNDCLSTIRDQGCQDAIDSLHEEKACGTDDMCVD